MSDKIIVGGKFSLEDSEIIDMGPIDNLLKLSPISEMVIKKEVGYDKLPSRYIINKNATILFWEDGSKTVVKRCEDDKYDKRLGFLIGYFQKNSGLSKTKANKFLRDLVEENNGK